MAENRLMVWKSVCTQEEESDFEKAFSAAC